jgi:hypothetical protein
MALGLTATQPGGFNGQFKLIDPVGTFWADYTQTGNLELSALNDGIVGGGDRVRITANGDSITFSSNYTWLNVGTDDVSIVDGDINIFFAWKVSPTEINYCVKVITP